MTSINYKTIAVDTAYELLFSQYGMAVFLLDSVQGFLRVSSAIESLTGHRQGDLLGKQFRSLVFPGNDASVDELFSGVAGVPVKRELRIIKTDSTLVNCIVAGIGVTIDREPCSIGVIGHKQPLDPEIEAMLRTFTMAVEQSPATVVITDKNGSIEYVNPKFTRLTGYDFNEALKSNPRVLKSGRQSPEFYRELWQTITSGKEWRGEFHNKKKNGEYYWESASISPIMNEIGEITHFVAVKEDITDRKRAEEELRITSEILKEKNSEMEKELLSAQIVTNLLLPHDPPKHERIRAGFRFNPLEAIGGDFFSFNTLHEGGLGVFIGDVAGHGVSAALFLTLLRSLTDRLNAARGASPSHYIRDLNGNLVDGEVLFFITALYGFFNFSGGDAAFHFAKGGHTPPIHYNAADGSVRILTSAGMPVGLSGSAEFQELTVDTRPGDRIYLYTDGIIETRNEKDAMIEPEGLQDIVAQCGSMSLTESLDYIMSRVDSFRGSIPAQDDILIIGFEIIY